MPDEACAAPPLSAIDGSSALESWQRLGARGGARAAVVQRVPDDGLDDEERAYAPPRRSAGISFDELLVAQQAPRRRNKRR